MSRDLLLAFGCSLARCTIPGNLLRAATAARQHWRDRLRSGVVVQAIALDCTHVTLNGRQKVVIQTVNAHSGLTLEIMVLPGEDEQRIVRYVRRMAKLTGCRVKLTDDADVFKAATDAAGVEHRYRTMRGYKSGASLRVVPSLAAYVRQNQGTACLTSLLTA